MLGVGYFPVAPATAASAVMALLIFLVGPPSAEGYLVILPVLFLIGVYLSGVAEQEWGKDSGKIVIDEVVGFLVSIAFIQFNDKGGLGGGLLLAFFLFRFYDIVKPFPANRCQSLSGGWGVMIDDLFAGIYANLTLRIFQWLFWSS
jgi:phosphatidylglycerophosphatase A